MKEGLRVDNNTGQIVGVPKKVIAELQRNLSCPAYGRSIVYSAFWLWGWTPNCPHLFGVSVWSRNGLLA